MCKLFVFYKHVHPIFFLFAAAAADTNRLLLLTAFGSVVTFCAHDLGDAATGRKLALTFMTER